MNAILKRVISLMLCFVLLVGYVPVSAFATESGETVTAEATDVTTAPIDVVSDEPEAPSESTEAPTDPSQETTAPTDATTAPTDATTAPTDATTAPTDAPTEPTDATTAPTEAATVPTEAPTEPEEEDKTEISTGSAVTVVKGGSSATFGTTATEASVGSNLVTYATGNVIDAAIFFSDLHTSSNDYKESTVTGIMNGLKSSGLNFSSVTSCGDAFSVNADNTKYTGEPSKITGYIQSVFAGIPVNYVWSDHDRYAGLDNDSGFIYGAGADGTYGTADDGNYYIYELSMADLSTNNRYNADFHTDAEVTATIAEFVADADKLDQTKPLFIASHQPLLDRRNDNGHALEWATAINTVAEDMDVAFFFGHNHRYDEAADYYYAKGSTMSVCKDSSGNAQDVKLNFTHMCTGYLAPASTNSTSSTTRQGTAMAVAIFEDEIQYVTYNASGEYTGSYALNKTVTRDHTEAETEEPTEPTEPSQPETPVEVEKRDDATGIVVRAPGLTGINVETMATDSDAYAAVAQKLSQYTGYDIEALGYTDGDLATVIMPIPEGVTVPAVYHVSDDAQTATEMNITVDADRNVVTFTTNHFSYYVIGEDATEEAESGSVTTGGTSYAEKTLYVRVDAFENGEKYLLIGEDGPDNGNPIALINNNGSDTTANVTVQTGSVEVDGVTYSKGYIELSNSNAVFTASSNSNGYTLKNGNYYIGGTGATTLYNASNNAVSVTYDATAERLKTASSTIRYLYYSTYSNDTWKWSTSSSSSTSSRAMYIYKEVTAKIPTSDQVIYTMKATDLNVVLAKSGTTTGQLEYTLLGNGASVALPTGGSYTFGVAGDTDGIISDISDTGLVTFTGKEGSCRVKIAYTWGENTVYKYVTVNASLPTYKLDITKDETVVTGTTLTKKGVTATTTLQLGTKFQYIDENGANPAELPEGTTITWTIPEEYQNIATVDDNGLITFKGVDGAFYVTATLTVNGKDYTAGVNISATTSLYSVPSDGVTDFPEYPNEGAIRYDKTATAVGNFSQTGIAQVELSMTGVPYTTGSEMDVVLMLDRSSSMYKSGVQHRISSTVEATKAFIKNIVVNADGSFNNNRILVLDFLGGNLNTSAGGGSSHKFQSNRYTTNEDNGYQIISTQAELDALLNKIETDFKGQTTLYGTEYAQGLKACYDALNASRSDGNKQFCVFMSDGIPNYMRCENTYFDSTSDIVGMFDVTNRTAANGTATRNANEYEYEYYSTQMKNEGVTVFTVGLGLKNTNSAWSGTSAAVCEQVANMLLNDIAGPAGETAVDRDTGKTVSKLNSYFYSVADDNAAADMKNVFAGIAQKILQAATDVTVEDQITDQYTMIFDIPEGSKDITGVTNDFYIEFGKYALDENHERTEDGFTSITKLYLKNTNGTLSAASDKSGTAYATPTFAQKTIGDKGTLYYWSKDAADGDTGVSVTVDGTTYYFVSYGMETAGYNMTSGAYASGTVDSTTNMSKDLVIATPYFVYNAATKMLYWTVDKLDTEEYALRYFLYLNNSATEVGTSKETDPGSYLTNDHAYITYTNFNGNDCRQEFPKPQLTWNGAQVSYVFYLVNAAGQPINKSGQLVDFANATFVTDVFTKSVVWNKEGDTTTGTGELSANWLADDLLPDTYEIYDEQAQYKLNVYENANGSTIKNQFTISGGTAAEISDSLNTRLELNTTTASIATTKVYNTKAGQKITDYGTYYSTDTDMAGFDFANTTVAFAVVWQPRLVPDAVVVDYGLDVLINVTQNDILQNKVSGIGEREPSYSSNVAMNSGVSTSSKLGTAALTIDGNTISIENENAVRFHQNDMQFADPVVFYYETPVEFWEGSDPTEGYMYSSVTVIPATTIYYEDSFVTLESYSKGDDGTFTKADGTGAWTTEGTTVNATQDQDRPGASQISAALDADNNYGYDSAYVDKSTHSLGSAAKITVDEKTRGEATFTFYGTGFDIIGLTSDDTGMLIVEVFDSTGKQVKSSAVDTYYGYAYGDNDGDGTSEWYAVTSDSENALYQVPVMKISGLTYGKYTAKLTAGWNKYFDHVNGSQEYDLYLDAIRIYDPTGNKSDVANNAYAQDGEAHPEYTELRDLIISADTFDSLNSDTVSGVVFIDGMSGCSTIKDYTSYGPNNELYLAAGQAVAGVLDAGNATSVQLAIKTVGGTGKIEVYGVKDGTTVACLSETISSATDMYYDITALNGMTLVVKNAGSTMDAIVSITNIKCTYGSAPVYPVSLADVNTDEAGKVTAQVTYSNNTSKTVEVVETSVTNEDGSVTYTYTYTEKVNSLTYTVSVTKTVAADSGVATASETSTSATSSKYLLSVNRSSVNSALATMNVEEDTVPETSVPETSEPETYEPETSEPETSEPETSVPEETEPETGSNQVEEAVKEAVKNVVNTVKSVLKKLFNRWFR